MLKKLVCLLAVLGMANAAMATIDWWGDGAGLVQGGNNWEFNDPNNWDDRIVPPPNDDWRVFGKYAAYLGNVDMTVTSSIFTSSGTIVYVAGKTCNLTINGGAELSMGGPGLAHGIAYNSPGALTIKSGGILDQKYGQLGLEHENLVTTVESGGLLEVSTLRHNNGTKLHVYGTLWAWTIGRIAIDSGWLFNVYDGGLLTVAGTVPTTVWSTGDPGVVGMFIGSTVEMVGDHTGDWSNKVEAKEAGIWEVDFGISKAGYTTVKLVPEPATALFLLAGLPLLRRRRA